jgi:KaiC/GvpD/RAD55 family RecA-like ATPase/tetratricopeptide (TPR) repeat protein
VWLVSLKAEILAEPVLVGREQELAELEHYRKLATEGKGTTVFVSGEAGAGKTKLVTEFLKRAKKQGVTVLSGWCLSEAAVPYFPFIEAFNAYFGSFNEEEPPIVLQQPETKFGLGGSAQIISEEPRIATWLTGARPLGKTGTPEGLSPQVWKDQAFAAVARTLHSISAKKPAILFIDDIQWADSASLALLHYLARAIDNSERILVLATFRGEELTVCPEGHPHSLAEALCMMRREELFTEIKLSNLNLDSVSKIAENMIGGRLQKEFAEKLSKESQGNALFVVESLRMLSERKSLIQENNEWRLAVDELGIPSKVRDIILRRLSMLKHAQRRVLDAASVIGEKFDVELLSDVVGQDSLEVLEILGIVAHSTSLVRVEGNFYRFDHAKSRDTIYDEIPAPLKKGYHARIAEKLESKSQNIQGLAASEIARHYIQAGNIEKAVKYSLVAGEDALAKFSNLEAIKHFSYVLDSVEDSPENIDTRSIALERLGDAYFANCRFKEAINIFERLATYATDKARLRAYRKAMDSVFFGPNDSKQILELAKRAEPYATFDRLESARIRFHKASGLKIDRRKEEMDKALRVLEEEYSLPDIARVLEADAFLEVTWGSQKKGLSAAQRSIAMTKELYGDSHELVRAIFWSALDFMIAGLFQESLEKLNQVLQFGEKTGDYLFLARACVLSSNFFETKGQIEKALSMSLKALKYYGKTDVQRFLKGVYADVGRQYAKLGNIMLAEEFINRIDTQTVSNNINLGAQAPINKRDEARTKAIIFAAKNQWKEAYKYLEDAPKVAKTTDFILLLSEVTIKADYVWILNKHGRTEEAKIHLKEIQKLRSEIDRRFGHVSIDANLLAPCKVIAGEEFEMRLDLVNVSRKTGLLLKVEGLLPHEFEVANLQDSYPVDESCINLKEKKITPFEVETIKLKVKAQKAGTFNLHPQLVYIDEQSEARTCKLNQATITVNTAKPKFEILPGRASTGFEDLDALLYGGVPEAYAMALTSPAIDERQLLIKRFLEAGAQAGETTFYITVEPNNGKALAEQYPSNFHLIVCNPQADAMVQNLPNVSNLKGVENLTEIDIALTKAFRTLDPADAKPKRACIEIVSDVLLQHHAVTTRKWLNGLLPTLKSKGFTTLAVINPKMHSQEEVHAIIGLFEGEIQVSEKETPQGTEKILRIRKLYNQKYLENELALSREKL